MRKLTVNGVRCSLSKAEAAEARRIVGLRGTARSTAANNWVATSPTPEARERRLKVYRALNPTPLTNEAKMNLAGPPISVEPAA